MKRFTAVPVLALVFVACMATDASAEQIFVEPHLGLDPPEEGQRADNDTWVLHGSVDIGFAAAPFESLPWLVGEVLLGVRPPRDAGLGEVGGSHISFGVRAQLDGMFRPGVFARAGAAYVVLRQFDNTGVRFLPIWSLGAIQDFHIDPNFFFGFAVSWEQYMYAPSDSAPDSWANTSIEQVLLSARLGWEFD